MKIGFSLSPGGLLLPYHLGVLDGLAYKKVLHDSTPLAGASAGAIAVACHGCGLSGPEMVQATADLSESVVDRSSQQLVQGLRVQMQKRIGPSQLQQIQERPGPVAIAYRQLFPQNRPVLQTQFASVEDLTEAVCYSSTFPFFSSPYPCALDQRLPAFPPRLVVDGFFTVPRERFGCPDFDHLMVDNDDSSDGNDDNTIVDRTVCVSFLPQGAIGLTAVAKRDCISPATDANDEKQMQRLLKVATTPMASGFDTYMTHYEQGFLDAEAWVARETQHNWSLPSSSSDSSNLLTGLN